MGRRALCANSAPFGQNIGWDFKRRMYPAKCFARQRNFGITERGAMNAGCALFVWRTKADYGFAADQAWPVIGLGGANRGGNGVHIMPVTA